MDSTPPSPSQSSVPRTRPKSISRLSKLRHCSGSPIPKFSLVIVPSSPRITTPSPEPPASSKPPYTLPLGEPLTLSTSPLKRSKVRLAEKPEVGDGGAIEVIKRCKNQKSIASPRSSRRSRRKLDQDIIIRDEREIIGGEEILVKPRKKRHNDRSTKPISIGSSKIQSQRTISGDVCNLDAVGEIIKDLVMWKDVSKSSLWFGLGTLCFLSCCFARGINFSIFSVVSRIGLLFSGVSFFSNSMRKRRPIEIKHEFKLNEDDILRVGRVILPAANLAISKTRRVFSGEAAMTLKVVPILLVGAEYGHLITLWRLLAFGFFISFTGPKLYSAYSCELLHRFEYWKNLAFEAWGSCKHKRVVAASAVTAFWNLTSIRTRIVAAFLCVVILRYRRQHSEEMADVEESEQAIVRVDIESSK